MTPESDKQIWDKMNDLPSPAKKILFVDKKNFESHDTHCMWDPWRNQM